MRLPAQSPAPEALSPLRLPLQRVAGSLRGRRRGRPEGLGAHAFPRRHQLVERLSATARKALGMGGARRPRGASARPLTPPGLRAAYLLLYDALSVVGEPGLEQSHFRETQFGSMIMGGDHFEVHRKCVMYRSPSLRSVVQSPVLPRRRLLHSLLRAKKVCHVRPLESSNRPF